MQDPGLTRRQLKEKGEVGFLKAQRKTQEYCDNNNNNHVTEYTGNARLSDGKRARETSH